MLFIFCNIRFCIFPLVHFLLHYLFPIYYIISLEFVCPGAYGRSVLRLLHKQQIRLGYISFWLNFLFYFMKSRKSHCFLCVFIVVIIERVFIYVAFYSKRKSFFLFPIHKTKKSLALNLYLSLSSLFMDENKNYKKNSIY